MRRQRTAAAVAALVVAALGTALGTALPAAAQHPGVPGIIAHGDDQFADIPCVDAPVFEPDSPLTRYVGSAITWSPDGGRVAADLEVPGGSTDVLVIDVADCSFVDLGPSEGRGLSFSPDGTRLALVRGGDVVVVDATTGEELERVTDTPGSESDPTFHPVDGTLAYAGEGGIRVAPANALVIPGGTQPDWSPDGTRIAYVPGGYGLAHAAADGGDVVLLPDRFAAADVVWSPDGLHLLYSGDYAPPGGTPDIGCWIVTPDGSRVAGLGTPNVCSVPAWQPLPAGSTPVPYPVPQPEVVVEPEQEDLTLGYLYRLLDPALPPSASNSGEQLLHAVTGGHAFADAVDLTGWSQVCGDGWGYRQVQTRIAWEDLPYELDPAADPLAVVAERHQRLAELTDVPACEPASTELTLTYLYRKVDPALPPSWPNSGPQTLLDVREGHAWHRDWLGALPDGVCGPGWAVQQDHTVGLTPAEVPEVVDRATATNVLGWGTVVLAARHHSLEYYLDVPACDAAGPVVGARAFDRSTERRALAAASSRAGAPAAGPAAAG